MTLTTYCQRTSVLREATNRFYEKNYAEAVSLTLDDPLAQKDDINTLQWKYELLAMSYYKLGQTDSALYFISKGFELGDIWPQEVLDWQESYIPEEDLYSLPYYPERAMRLANFFAGILPIVMEDYLGDKPTYLAKVDTQFRKELVLAVSEDQDTRWTYLADRSEENDQALAKADQRNQNWLRQYVSQNGWPGGDVHGYHELEPDVLVLHEEDEAGNLFYLHHMIHSAQRGKSSWMDPMVIMQNHYVFFAVDSAKWIGTGKLHLIQYNKKGNVNLEKSLLQMISLGSFIEHKLWPYGLLFGPHTYNRRNHPFDKRTAQIIVLRYPDENIEDIQKYQKGLKQIYDYMIEELEVSPELLTMASQPYLMKEPQGVRVRYGVHMALHVKD
ncbi:MAG: hypothetical protein AAFP89_17015 [Bacteroidota bacterium]